MNREDTNKLLKDVARLQGNLAQSRNARNECELKIKDLRERREFDLKEIEAKDLTIRQLECDIDSYKKDIERVNTHNYEMAKERSRMKKSFKKKLLKISKKLEGIDYE